MRPVLFSPPLRSRAPSGERRTRASGSFCDTPVAAWTPTLRTRHYSDRYGLIALALYFLLSMFVFGRALRGHWSDYHFGVDIPADSTIFVWSLAWWRHALLNHLDPLVTNLIWAPGSINLAWVTLAPFAAVLAIPATSAFGPIATCNFLFILAPALSAWAAFILCRHLSNRYWPALLGGYVFGFSAYTLGQMQGHLHLVLAFPVPLAVYLAVRRYDGTLRRSTFVALMALTLAAEFLIALEVFATMTLFGAVAIALVFLISQTDTRAHVAALVLPLALAYALAALIVSPFIFRLLEPGAMHWGSMYAADPVGFLIPTDYFELGRLAIFRSIADRLPFNNFECDTYFGPVLIVIAALYGRRHWRDPIPRAMLIALLIIAITSLGPNLRIMGHVLIGLPGALVMRLPLMGAATPARFALYAHLILAAIAAIWFAESNCRPITKTIIASLLVISTLPNLAPGHWTRPTRSPAFFTDGLYRKYLSPGETVITLPYWMSGNGMLWQAQSDMYFRTAGDWTGPPPPEFDRWPIVKALATNMLPPDPEAQLKAFVANHDVGAVIAGDDTDPVFRPMLASLDPSPLTVGGVTLYRVRPAEIAPYRKFTALEMETRASRERLEALIIAANRYLAAGRDPAELNPRTADRLGLIPPGWGRYDSIIAFNTIWVGPANGGDGVIIGLTASYAALRPLIEKYRGDASAIFFPFPARFREGSTMPGETSVFMITFDRSGLARAAAKAAASSPAAAATK